MSIGTVRNREADSREREISEAIVRRNWGNGGMQEPMAFDVVE
jgi:hypothetical protein